jgi:hypothetical protein
VAHRGDIWVAREVLQVRQVPAVYSRPRGHLADGEPLFRSPSASHLLKSPGSGTAG